MNDDSTHSNKPQEGHKSINADMYNMEGVQFALYEQSKKGKNFNNLAKLVMRTENIVMAYKNVKANKGAKTPGTDGLTIDDVNRLTTEEMVSAVRAKFNWYNPKAVKRVEIPKPNGKTRPLGIPTIWDRIIQQCILQILEPICEAKFLDNSKGFRPGKSAEDAMASLMYNVNRRQMTYVVDVDIKGFFDNVDHTKLMRLVWNMGIHDKQLLVVIRKMLKAPIKMPNGTLEYPEKGTPQGGILSPLLANIYLHELDKWLVSQWENFPTKYQYKEPPGRDGLPTRSKANRALRTTKLKEIHHVRYADDFKIVCHTEEEAKRIYAATQMWLKEELKLDTSPEKSRITDIKVEYTEFLGFKIRAIQKAGKWIGVSYISDKALKQIYKSLTGQIGKMGRARDVRFTHQEIAKYNVMVMGIHNYYRIATGVNTSLSKISLGILRKLYTRTKRDGFTKTCPKPVVPIPKGYGRSKQVRYISGYPVLPIGYCRTHNAKQAKKNENAYKKEGKRRLVSQQISLMWKRKLTKVSTIEFVVSCISRYSAQKGLCAITGRFLLMDEFEGHHKVPRYKGGGDEYENIVILCPEAHYLVKATDPVIIQELLEILKLNKEQLKKLNKLREMYGTKEITS